MRTHVITRRSGFTILELMISISIVAMLLGTVSLFQMRSQDSYQQTSARSQAENACRRSMARVLDELTGIAISRLVPDPTSSLGTSTLVFQRPEGVSNTGAVDWSSQSRIELLLDTGELDNGLDDDGDSLVDERRLVLTRGIDTATPQAVTERHGVAEWLPGETANGTDDNGNGVVDERGFSVQRVGNLLFVRLAVEVPFAGGRAARWTSDTALTLRN